MKGFWEQKYPFILKVAMKFEEIDELYYDEIKGLNKGHALYMAKNNWPCATWIKPADELVGM